MQVRLKRLAVLVVAIAFLGGAFSLAGAAGDDAKALFETKCSKCHGFEKPFAATKSMEDWQKVVTKMQQKAPDWISDEDAAAIVDYLTQNAGK